MNVNGGIVTNIASSDGNSAAFQLVGLSNQVVVTHGGQVWVNYLVSLGINTVSNQIMVSGTGSVFATTSLGVGEDANLNKDSGNYNSAIVSNGAQLLSSGQVYIGGLGSNNFAVVTGPVGVAGGPAFTWGPVTASATV